MTLLKQLMDWLINETSVYFKSITLPIAVGGVYKSIKYLIAKVSDNNDQKSLFPYYSTSIIKNAKRNYIRTKCQNIDPANETNYKSSFAFTTKEDLQKFFIKKVLSSKFSDTQFYLILGDSGMGKTTFMLNLFSKYNSLFYHPLKKRKIKLLPLGEKSENIQGEILQISQPSECVLLLDAFDEIPILDGKDIFLKFHELIEITRKFRFVIITCRTHFFASENEEPYVLKVKKYTTEGNDFHTIRKIYVSPFDDNDIKRYINKAFKLYEFSKKKKAYQIVKNTNDLMVRPMLLSNIRELVNIGSKVPANTFDIYELLIISWLERESKRYEFDARFDFRYNLIHFTYAVTNSIYENYEINGLFLPPGEALRISNLYQINLNEIEIQSRSLLNRNAAGHYKFSHKSFFEFFIAFLAFTERWYNGGSYTIKYDLTNFDFAKRLIEDMINSQRVDFKLPLINEGSKGFNTEHFKKILKARVAHSGASVEWLSGNSFKI